MGFLVSRASSLANTLAWNSQKLIPKDNTGVSIRLTPFDHKLGVSGFAVAKIFPVYNDPSNVPPTVENLVATGGRKLIELQFDLIDTDNILKYALQITGSWNPQSRHD